MDQENNVSVLINEIQQEYVKITEIPTTKLTMRQQQVELNLCCQCINECISHILEEYRETLKENMHLLERLKHSESERFSNKR